MGNKQSNNIPDTAPARSRTLRRSPARRRAATMAAIRRADGRVDYRTRDVERIYPNVYARKGTVPGIYFQTAQNLDTLFQDAIEADAAREAANNMRSPGTPVTPVPDPVLAAIIQRLNEEERLAAVARMEAARAAVEAARAARVTDLPDWDRRVIPQEEALADAERALEDAERALEDSAVVRLFGAGINEELLQAVNSGNYKEVKRLLEAGANMEATDNYGQTALMKVMNFGDDDPFGIARLFIEKGANGWEAALEELLRRAGVKRGDPWQNRTRKRSRDPNWVVSESKRPRDPTWDASESASYLGNRLIQAVSYGQAEVVRQLLAAPGIDVNTVNDKGYTALMVAAEMGEAEAVRQLLAAPGIDVNTVNDKGYTALMYAAEEGQTIVVMQLLAAPDINMYLKNADGMTAWLIAIDGRYEDISQLFIQQPI